MSGPKGAVRVLHRATDGDNGVGGNGQSKTDSQAGTCLLEQLQAANESLKQRLDQAKASAVADRKRLADELKLEKAGRQRAEELLVRQAKELEACAAAKARLEEAFSRSMSELRYTRLEHAQAEQTIQQLLRELMQLRDALSRSYGAATSSAGAAGQPVAAAAATTSGIAAGDMAPGGGAASAGGVAAGASSKQMSKGKLLGELQQLRAAMAAAESKLGALEAEKERAEECQEMISRQTAKLLDDRAALLSNLNNKDEAVRGLQAGLDHLEHQLHIALADRNLLLQQLRTLAGDAAAPEMAALTAAMTTGFSNDLSELGIGHFGASASASPAASPAGAAPAAAGVGGAVSPRHLLSDEQQLDLQHFGSTFSGSESGVAEFLAVHEEELQAGGMSAAPAQQQLGVDDMGSEPHSSNAAAASSATPVSA